MNECCNNLKWKYEADANSADGCEFTIGSCENCKANLIHLYHPALGGEGHYEVVNKELVENIMNLRGKEQKEYMREWYRRQ
jgi:hypothetical protein